MKIMEITREAIPGVNRTYKYGHVMAVVNQFDMSSADVVQLEPEANEYTSARTMRNVYAFSVKTLESRGDLRNKIQVMQRKDKVYLLKE